MMRLYLTMVLSISFALFINRHGEAEVTSATSPGQQKVKGQRTSPYTMFFDPQFNGVRLDKQRLDYDLTKETEFRLGPFLLNENQVSMQMTREQGSFSDIEFGFEPTIKYGPIYLLSFTWPKEFVREGLLEIINDRAQNLWRREVTAQDVQKWEKIINSQSTAEIISNFEQKPIPISDTIKTGKPPKLSQTHRYSHFGLAHKGFYEIPISQITEPFRFCLSYEKYKSRLAVCSKRYQFQRERGRYSLKVMSKDVRPQVLVNDKEVTLRGSAIFLENDLPTKISALLKSGVYFEFVSHPKDVRFIDMVFNKTTQRVEVTGYGDEPLGEVSESFLADNVNWGFLNFTPTIGDLRQFWRMQVSPDAKYLYLRGQGGAPFRQSFDYEALPSTTARIVLSEQTTKSTYKSSVVVKGRVDPEIKVDAEEAEVRRVSPNEFEWEFPTPEPGLYNKSFLRVYEKEHRWMAGYEIYRGFPAELGLRLTGILTNNLTLVLMGEVAGQYWFESLFGWDHYHLSKQRWGVSAKYFEAIKGTKRSLSKLAAGNVDIKYRLTPGVWGRDPTVGLIVSGLNLDYGFSDDLGRVAFSVPVLGGGVFWARSMPQVFDDLFNLIPFMRYPKWVDWEFVAYPITIREKQKSNYMFTMNFHGKVQWTRYFYGEGGFGLKNLSFSDHHFGDPNKQLDPKLGILYSQVGLGFNF